MSIKRVLIKGFQRTSLVDYPGNVVSTVFLAGCNMRCGFCHNPELALNDPSLKALREEDILREIENHRRFIDGVCITGGEPLMQDIRSFLSELKKMGLKVKVDTNGTFPSMLMHIIDKKLVDYVAMDVKLPLYDYRRLGNVDSGKVEESINILKAGRVDYEFRTTVVPSVLDSAKLVEIAENLAGGKLYVLQQFIASEKVLDSEFSDIKSYSAEELKRFAKLCSKFIPTHVRL